ncbi:MAG TPA: PTS sugar transporter subunit IIC [bacterium]|jgi:mannose/fructose/N-acetylgalactosamine-specific phosphotransferase system component IIC
MLEAVWVALAGAFVYLDTTAVAQFMISQPLIACPLWGLLVGRPEVGLFFGVAFQLIWLGSLPIGAAKIPEGNVGALIATALACRVPPTPEGNPAWITLTIAAVVGLLVSQLGAQVTPLVRTVLIRYSDYVVLAAQAGRRARFSLLFLGAIGLHLLAGFLLTLAAFLGGKWVMALYLGKFSTFGVSAGLIAETDRLLSGLWPGLLGAGVAVIAARFVHRRTFGWFAVSAVIGLGVSWLWL